MKDKLLKELNDEPLYKRVMEMCRSDDEKKRINDMVENLFEQMGMVMTHVSAVKSDPEKNRLFIEQMRSRISGSV